MRLYGYPRQEINKNGLLEMKEVTISANPKVLKALSDFLLSCADKIEKNQNTWSHDHFIPPNDQTGKHTPTFVVCNPRFK